MAPVMIRAAHLASGPLHWLRPRFHELDIMTSMVIYIPEFLKAGCSSLSRLPISYIYIHTNTTQNTHTHTYMQNKHSALSPQKSLPLPLPLDPPRYLLLLYKSILASRAYLLLLPPARLDSYLLSPISYPSAAVRVRVAPRAR